MIFKIYYKRNVSTIFFYFLQSRFFFSFWKRHRALDLLKNPFFIFPIISAQVLDLIWRFEMSTSHKTQL